LDTPKITKLLLLYIHKFFVVNIFYKGTICFVTQSHQIRMNARNSEYRDSCPSYEIYTEDDLTREERIKNAMPKKVAVTTIYDFYPKIRKKNLLRATKFLIQ